MPLKNIYVDDKDFVQYYNLLSDASKKSLKLQGGILNEDEAKEFESSEFFENSIKLRQFDENAKRIGIKIKSIKKYKNLLISKLIWNLIM